MSDNKEGTSLADELFTRGNIDTAAHDEQMRERYAANARLGRDAEARGDTKAGIKSTYSVRGEGHTRTVSGGLGDAKIGEVRR
jgi:hypothetical protein